MALNPAVIPLELNLGPRFPRVDGRRFKSDLVAAGPLTARLDKELATAGPGAFLISDGYGRLTGERLYLDGKVIPPPALVLLDESRRNAANFSIWEKSMHLDGRPAIFFSVDDPRDNREVEGRLLRLFEGCCAAPEEEIREGDVLLEKERILRCRGFKGFAARNTPAIAVPAPACAAAAP